MASEESDGWLLASSRRKDRAFRALETRQELERERRRLAELRSLVSHDLGNPLNLASGRLELARRDCESDQLDYVEGRTEAHR
jgi:signal transduction histidine kinase